MGSNLVHYLCDLGARVRIVSRSESPQKCGQLGKAHVEYGDLTRIDDCIKVEALSLMIDKYAVCDPVNVASNESVKIKDVVKLVLEVTNYNGKLEFDTSKK